MKVLIISGGSSSERKISVISAKAVKQALEIKGHTVTLFDLKKGFAVLARILPNYEVVFPVLHGAEGEGGELQAWLKDKGANYIGGDPKGMTEGFYKLLFKEFCNRKNIRTAKWKQIQTAADLNTLGFPVVLKNSEGGSSREVVILRSKDDLQCKIVQQLLEDESNLYIEQFLSGVEVTVGILDNKALPVVEIIPPEGQWFDYKNKYSGMTQEIPDAPSLTSEQREEVQRIALLVHQQLKLGAYSRIDFIIHEGNPYVLEVNTIPGLTAQSLFPKAAQAAGISFPELVDQLIQLAI